MVHGHSFLHGKTTRQPAERAGDPAPRPRASFGSLRRERTLLPKPPSEQQIDAELGILGSEIHSSVLKPSAGANAVC